MVWRVESRGPINVQGKHVITIYESYYSVLIEAINIYHRDGPGDDGVYQLRKQMAHI